MNEIEVKRGDVFYADLSPVVGSEQRGVRPVLIVQNDVGNQFSPTTIAAAITGKNDKTNMPTHVSIPPESTCLARNSVILLEQIRTIDKARLRNKLCTLDEAMMKAVDNAILISLGLADCQGNILSKPNSEH